MISLKKKNNSLKKFDITRFFSYLITILAVVLTFSVIVFIVIKSSHLLQNKNFFTEFLFHDNWSPNKEFGIWNFIVSTFWVVFLTMIFTFFINFFASVFISQFLPNWFKKKIIFLLRVFSGIPSILFGVFGAFVLVNFLQKLGVAQPKSMFAAILILTFMVLPTTLTLTIDVIQNVSKNYKYSGFALGIKPIYVAFDIIYRCCTRKVIMILFLGFARAIGEVTAIALVAGNANKAPDLASGAQNFFFTSISTLSSLIGLEIAEHFGKLHESALFGVALIIMLIVFLVNFLFFFLLQSEKRELLPFKLKSLISYKFHNTFFSKYYIFLAKLRHKILPYLRWFFMIFSFGLLVLGFGWLVGDILYRGMIGFVSNNFQGFHNLVTLSGNHGLLGVLSTTGILILGSLVFAFPLSFFVAIYLSEYAPYSRINKKISKIVRFIIYQLSSSPTIIFGLFGLALFVSLFGFGFTLLSASLTMVLIIFPIMTKAILQNLESVPDSYRFAAYGLGLSRQQIIWKVIVPFAFKGILVSWILGANKVIAESAALLVILGNSAFFPTRGFFSSGRTLATHIYFLQSESILSATEIEHLSYQAALLTILIIFFTNWLIVKLTKKRTFKVKSN